MYIYSNFIYTNYILNLTTHQEKIIVNDNKKNINYFINICNIDNNRLINKFLRILYIVEKTRIVKSIYVYYINKIYKK